MRHISFERKTLLRTDWFGLDSIQGILQFVEQYRDRGMVCFDTSNEANVAGIYFYFKQLERDVYIILNLEPKQDMPNTLLLRSATLTVNGHKLLEELNTKSRTGRVKKRIIDIVWTVVVSTITTLIALWIKGK